MSSRDGSDAPIEPIAVAELELCDPARAATPIVADSRARWIRVLLRAATVPVGWVWIDRQGTPTTEESPALPLAEVARNLAQRALQSRLESVERFALPPISIVICTRNRPELLSECLEAVGSLEYPEFEAVLVDNSRAVDEVAELASRYPIRYVRETAPGVGWARNRGVSETRHEIIALIDETVRVDRHWLRGIAKAFADPRVGLAVGLAVPGVLDTAAEQSYEFGFHEAARAFAPRDLDSLRTSESPFARARPVEPWRLLGSSDLGLGPNIAVRRSTLSKVGGFDTALGGVTRSRVGSDLDLMDRVLLAGRIVRYEPAALVWHDHPTTMGELRELRYDAGRSFGSYLLRRYGERRPSRRVVAGYVVRWIGGLLLGMPRRFLRRGRVPIPLLAAELWGALNAPIAQLRNRLQDRRVRRTRGANGS